MRKLIATAAALAPLMAATGVQAEVVISTARTTVITTSNATGSAADDIRLASGGSIAVTTGSAITIDSNNSVDLDSGSNITMANAADNAIGILAQGGNAGNITIGGTITLSDSQDGSTDTDSDGDLDGRFATGTNRYGVRVAGDEPLTGNILQEATSAITVEGNQSYGVSVEADLVGDLTLRGSVAVAGDGSYGVRTTGSIDGDVIVASSTAVLGEGSRAVSIEGDVSGSLLIQNSISSTGYRYTTRPNATAIEKLDADDLLQGGAALTVAGNVAGGILLDIPPVATDDDDEDDDDIDDDGVVDTAERSASITTFGAAPAIVVGAADRDIAIGNVGVDDEAFGFITRGAITATGVYDDVSATGIQIGVADGGAVNLNGGLRNEGAIAAYAIEAGATVIRLMDGVSADSIVNTGTLTSVSQTEGDTGAIGVLIEAGASVNSITNSGTVVVTTAGEEADSVGFRDLSGSVSSFNNTGRITALIVATDDDDDDDDDDTDAGNEVVNGQGIAIDLAANTGGVVLIQDGIDDGDDDNDDKEDADADGDGVDDADEPAIIGAILLGSGDDVADIRNGTVTGPISFGDGADRLSISGGAVVRSAISDSDGLLDIEISNGTLEARNTSALTVTNLEIGADGDLIVTLDPENDSAARFDVTGTATLADGAGLGVRFASLIDSPTRYTIIDAETLNVGAIDADSIEENSPYLVVASAGVDQAAGEVYVDVRRRTAAEANLIPVEAAAYDAVYEALRSDSTLRDAFLAQAGRDDFINLYEQMLPDHSGGPLVSLATGVDAVTRALTGRNRVAALGQTSAWLQEVNFYADKDKTDTYGFRSEGFGVAGGVERGTTLGAVGVSLAFTSSDLEDPEAEAEENLSASLIELGLYWRAQGQHWTTWARAAAGYASFEADRAFVGEGVFLSNESDWNGLTLAAAAGASYERSFGRYSIRPEAYVEYFNLREDSRVESGGGDGFDLLIEEREGHLLAATAAVNFGATFGRDGWLRPEIRVGWRQNISVDPGETIARFASGGSSFTLTPDSIEGGGPILGFRINIGNDLGLLTIEGDAEMIDDYVRYMLLLRASFRF